MINFYYYYYIHYYYYVSGCEHLLLSLKLLPLPLPKGPLKLWDFVKSHSINGP